MVLMYLPNGWVEIPKQVIDETFGVHYDSAGISVPEYNCGFQSDNGMNYFSFPYMLVQNHDEAVVPIEEWNKMKKKGIDYFKKHGDGVHAFTRWHDETRTDLYSGLWRHRNVGCIQT
jgi:hypothetical protein